MKQTYILLLILLKRGNITTLYKPVELIFFLPAGKSPLTHIYKYLMFRSEKSD
jgi:hypothetical protein